MRGLLLFLFSMLAGAAFAEDLPSMDFRADFYQRDLTKNTIKGKGKAWVKREGKEIWADEIEVDFALNRAFASGNVRIKDGSIDIYADRGNYSLDGTDATLENGTLIFGQTVLSGMTLRKISGTEFEMEEGLYTNCNIKPYEGRDAGKCPFDIKIYGRKFSLTIGGYIHVYDATIYAKELPIFFTPYFMGPAKSQRESGILMPSVGYRDRLGTGFSLPYFWAISSWQDLTFTPTFWGRAGHHTGFEYNYSYSRTKEGQARVFLAQYPFGDDRSQPWIRPKESRYAGFFSEIGFDLHNRYSLGGRAHTRQDISLVSDPYFHQSYPEDFGSEGDLQYLRSTVSVTVPGDDTLLLGTVRATQSLVNTLDSDVDQGSAAKLPEVRFAHKTQETPLKYLLFDFDTRVSNYYRSTIYDNVPPSRPAGTILDADPKPDPDPDPAIDGNDYIRAGRRLWFEPRLTANMPFASGFQFQPAVKGGLLAYHFDLPESQFLSQRYADGEVPLSLYLSRVYETKTSGFERIRHIIQPRVLYSSSLYRSAAPSHQFFQRNDYPGFTNPRFDAIDDVREFEFFLLEFNNRFLRRVGPNIERFLLLQVSNRYFLKPHLFNANQAGLGPLELLMEFRMGPISAQVQGKYSLIKTNGIHPNSWTGGITYSVGEGSRNDSLTFSTSLSETGNRNDDQQAFSLSFYKTLPVFLDVFGSVERSVKEGRYRSYQMGFAFLTKPASCWSLSLVSGKRNNDENYAKIVFGLDFGGPAAFSTSGI